MTKWGQPSESTLGRVKVAPECCGPGRWLLLKNLRRHVLGVHHQTVAKADAAFEVAREAARTAVIRHGRTWVRLGPEPPWSPGLHRRRKQPEFDIAEARAEVRKRRARRSTEPAPEPEDGKDDSEWYRKQLDSYREWVAWLAGPYGPGQ